MERLFFLSGRCLQFGRWSRDFSDRLFWTGSRSTAFWPDSSFEILSRLERLFVPSVGAKKPDATRLSCSARAAAIRAAMFEVASRAAPPLNGFRGEEGVRSATAAIEYPNRNWSPAYAERPVPATALPLPEFFPLRLAIVSSPIRLSPFGPRNRLSDRKGEGDAPDR